jgi:hypothetical protein
MVEDQLNNAASAPVPKNASGAQAQSALAGLVARVQLVDDVDPALAANQTVFAMAGLQRLERILDLHFSDPRGWKKRCRPFITIYTIKSAPTGTLFRLAA